MKKLLVWLVAVCVMLVALVGCAPLGDTGTTTGETTTTTTEVPGKGGGNWDMIRTHLLAFAVDYGVAEYNGISHESLEAWINTFETMGGTRPLDECNLYTQITEFSISREQLEEYRDWCEERFNEQFLTDEQVEALYTGTMEEINRVFASPFAVVAGDKVYSPQWLTEHTAEEYLAGGITCAILEEQVANVLGPCNETQREHIRAQWDRLKELEAKQ